jgi:hypothetical protein
VIFERECVIIVCLESTCNPVTFVNEQKPVVSIIIRIITVLAYDAKMQSDHCIIYAALARLEVQGKQVFLFFRDLLFFRILI